MNTMAQFLGMQPRLHRFNMWGFNPSVPMNVRARQLVKPTPYGPTWSDARMTPAAFLRGL